MNVPENFRLNFKMNFTVLHDMQCNAIVDQRYYMHTVCITIAYMHIAHISPKQTGGKFLRCDVMVSKFICAHRICWCSISISMSKWRTPFACANYFLIWFRSLWDWTWCEMNTLNLLFLQAVKVTVCVLKTDEVDRRREGRRVKLSCIFANSQHTNYLMPGVFVTVYELHTLSATLSISICACVACFLLSLFFTATALTFMAHF